MLRSIRNIAVKHTSYGRVLTVFSRPRSTVSTSTPIVNALHPLSRTPKYYDEAAVYTVGAPSLTEPYMVAHQENLPSTGDEINVFFLGTSSACATRSRNVSSIAVKIPNQDTWVFDAGEGTNNRIQSLSFITPSSISKIFISHLHTDHVMGLPSLLVSIDVISSKSRCVDIYGPLGLSQFVSSALRFCRPDTLSRIRIHELIPANIPPEALPVRALYANNLPPAQRCSKPNPFAPEGSTRRADRVEYYFADRTVDLSKHDPTSNSVDGYINTRNVKHRSSSRSVLGQQARATPPITFTFKDVTVKAVLGQHSTASWGWVIEEASFANMRKDVLDDIPKGVHLRALKEGRAVAIVKPEYSETSLFLTGNAKKQLSLPPLGPYTLQSDLRNDSVLAPLVAATEGLKRDYLDLGPPPADPACAVTFPEEMHPALRDHFTILDPRGLVETLPGRKLVLLFDCMGGNRMSTAAIRECQGCDLLVHEATFFKHTPSVTSEAPKKAHSTAAVASHFARQVGAKTLVLNHFSPRYRDDAVVGLSAQHAWLRHESGVAQVSVAGETLLQYMSESLMSIGGHLLEAAAVTGLVAKRDGATSGGANGAVSTDGVSSPINRSVVDADVEDVDDDSMSEDGEEDGAFASQMTLDSWLGLEKLKLQDQIYLKDILELRQTLHVTTPPPNAVKALLLAHDFMVLKVHRNKRR